MKKLADISASWDIVNTRIPDDVEFRALAFDSRKVKKGDVFFALPGTIVDGYNYIESAIERGAKIIVSEREPGEKHSGVIYITVKDAHRALALAACAYYGHPSKKLKLTGITGTNGKTTMAVLLRQLFEKAGFKSGLISTVGIHTGSGEYAPTHTTPDPLMLNAYLKEMVDNGVTHCFMEVSSHGIAQHRIAGLQFAGAVFTNLTHDHLDYHGTFKNYRDTKKEFFDGLPETAFALTNSDDRNGAFMLQNTKARKRTYAMKTAADYHVKILENTLSGLHLRINEKEVWTRLIGKFNAYNLTAIYAVAREYGLPEDESLLYLSELQSVKGRFEYFVTGDHISVIVDYAHTPDALKNVLGTLAELKKPGQNILTVVGAGGNRDKSKRPKMAEIAARMSDKLILTSDNPRDENPEDILDDMMPGLQSIPDAHVLRISDRKEAIKTARMLAKPGDMVLIAGKGHESYQEIKGVRYDFDDMEIAKEYFITRLTH